MIRTTTMQVFAITFGGMLGSVLMCLLSMTITKSYNK